MKNEKNFLTDRELLAISREQDYRRFWRRDDPRPRVVAWIGDQVVEMFRVEFLPGERRGRHIYEYGRPQKTHDGKLVSWCLYFGDQFLCTIGGATLEALWEDGEVRIKNELPFRFMYHLHKSKKHSALSIRSAKIWFLAISN